MVVCLFVFVAEILNSIHSEIETLKTLGKIKCLCNWIVTLGGACVDNLGMMLDDLLDQTCMENQKEKKQAFSN